MLRDIVVEHSASPSTTYSLYIFIIFMTMMFLWLAVVMLSISLKLTAATPTWLNQVYKLDLSEKTKIYLPNDASYVNETTQRYTTFQAPIYGVSIKLALAGDVQIIAGFSFVFLVSSYYRRGPWLFYDFRNPTWWDRNRPRIFQEHKCRSNSKHNGRRGGSTEWGCNPAFICRRKRIAYVLSLLSNSR